MIESWNLNRVNAEINRSSFKPAQGILLVSLSKKVCLSKELSKLRKWDMKISMGGIFQRERRVSTEAQGGENDWKGPEIARRPGQLEWPEGRGWKIRDKVIATTEESDLFAFGATARTLVSTLSKSTSWEIPGWKKHKLESRLLGEISIISDTKMTPPLWQKLKN